MGKLGPVDWSLNQWLTAQLTACSQGVALPGLEQQRFKAFGLNPKFLSERRQSLRSTQRSVLPYQSEPRHLVRNLPTLKVSI
jgi:hypothetical protein